jgi:hypothetical protein
MGISGGAGEGSGDADLLPPVTPDVVEAVALHHGVCIRPVPGALTSTPICHVNRDAKKPQP